MRDVTSIILTGACGFVGRHLASELAKTYPAAARVAIFREDSKKAIPEWEGVYADIADRLVIADIIETHRPDLVIHLAAQSSVGEGLTNAEETWRVNLNGTFALASAVARHSPSAIFFFTSTSEVYGANFNIGPVTEDTPPAPLNAYSASKAAAEQLLRDVLPTTVRLLIVRAFNHTGPGQDERFVIPSFAAQIARIEMGLRPPVLRVGNLNAKRDILDVTDVIDAYMRLLTTDHLPERLTVNVASGKTTRIGDLLNIMRRLASREFEIATDPNRLRPSDIPVAAGDASRLRQLVGWAPLTSSESMLLGLLEWWRNEVRNTEMNREFGAGG